MQPIPFILDQFSGGHRVPPGFYRAHFTAPGEIVPQDRPPWFAPSAGSPVAPFDTFATLRTAGVSQMTLVREPDSKWAYADFLRSTSLNVQFRGRGVSALCITPHSNLAFEVRIAYAGFDFFIRSAVAPAPFPAESGAQVTTVTGGGVAVERHRHPASVLLLPVGGARVPFTPPRGPGCYKVTVYNTIAGDLGCTMTVGGQTFVLFNGFDTVCNVDNSTTFQTTGGTGLAVIE